MKVNKCILSLALLCVISLTSCGHYPAYEEGTWENQDPITFSEADQTIESLKVVLLPNEEEDFVYSELDRWAIDGGEYLSMADLILYVYVDDVLLYDLFPYANLDGFTYQAMYFYNDTYNLDIQLTFTEATSKKDSFFEARLWLTPYHNNDPYSYDRSGAERCTPSSITLYKV
ncbi:MAG: hypothetical protein LUD22_00140 [Coprobacillus sp.]|nr:hypothetical protein [Coprobacillus sp.]